MVDEHAGVAMMGCVSNGRQIGYRARARSSEAAKNGIKVRRLITQYGNYDFSMTTSFVIEYRFAATYYTSRRRSLPIDIRLQMEWSWRNRSFRIGL